MSVTNEVIARAIETRRRADAFKVLLHRVGIRTEIGPGLRIMLLLMAKLAVAFHSTSDACVHVQTLNQRTCAVLLDATVRVRDDLYQTVFATF